MKSIILNDQSIFEVDFFISNGEVFLADHPHEECSQITSACDGISGTRDAAVAVAYLDDDDDEIVHQHRFIYEGAGILGFESALRREILEGFMSCNTNTSKRVRVTTEILT